MLARQGGDAAANLRALASQVHPVFMLPAIAVSLFGGLLAPTFAWHVAWVHALAVFCGLYTAHVADGYVDFYHRGEDTDHRLTAAGCRFALAGATVGFVGCLLALWALVGFDAVLITAPGWLIGYHHAPQLDMHPVTATLGYPAGIALALLGGYFVQSGTLPIHLLAYATIFFVTLAGVKVIDDATDVGYDRSIQKQTVAVVVGRYRARHAGYGAMTIGMVLTVGSALSLATVPLSVALAPVLFGAVALLARDRPPAIATMLLIRGVYLFLATVLVAIWLQPLR